MSKVLWLDNDLAYTVPYVSALERRGHTVTVVKTISQCEELLKAADTAAGYQLLILVFWNNWAARLNEMNTKVLALTVRLDRGIREKFVEAGLPAESFCTKMDLRDTDEFLKRVVRITGRGEGEMQ